MLVVFDFSSHKVPDKRVMPLLKREHLVTFVHLAKSVEEPLGPVKTGIRTPSQFGMVPVLSSKVGSGEPLGTNVPQEVVSDRGMRFDIRIQPDQPVTLERSPCKREDLLGELHRVEAVVVSALDIPVSFGTVYMPQDESVQVVVFIQVEIDNPGIVFKRLLAFVVYIKSRFGGPVFYPTL